MEVTELFTIQDFNNVMLFIWNRGFYEFAKMYESIGFIGEAYAEEKFHKAQHSFSDWWLNLDLPNQKKVMLYVKNYYTKKEK